MIKLIVSDLDGTLLNSKQQISDRTLRAIKQIQRKGLRLLINTEQNYFDAKKLLDAYDISCDIACFGGSCIFDTSGDQLHASYIPTKRIPEMLRIFGSCRTFYEIHSTRGLCVLGSKEGYTNYLSSEVVPALRAEFPSQTLDQESYICERLENAHFYDNGQLLLSENPQIIKITTQSLDQQKLEQLTNSLHTQVPHFAVSHQSSYRLDITAVNALKGAAVHFYTEKYQIPLKDTMVIGDSENDYSMLSIPGIHSVAMENACDMIRNICVYQTRANTRDGIAYIINCILADRENFKL